jgi:hypothetical protein
MVYSNQLQRNTGIVDPLIFSDEISDSYFWYHGYSTIKNHFLVRKDIQPEQSSVALGGKTIFKIPNIADKAGPVQLMWTQSNVTSDGTYTRYNDFLGFIAWEKIELIYSTGEIYVLYPEDCFKKYRQIQGIEQRDAQAEIIAGDKTPTQRDALALTDQELIVDLPFPHARATSRWLEIMQLAHEPRVEITWKKQEDIIETDGTAASVLQDNDAAVAISNPTLRVTYVHLDGDERDANTARTESEDGIIRLFSDFRIENVIIPSGTTGEYTIKINNFRTSTKLFAFMLRLNSDVTTNYANDWFGNLQSIEWWQLEGADGKIIEPIEDRYNRFYLHPMYHAGPAGEYLYEHSWALAPDDFLNATGSYNLGNTTNATLRISFGSDTTDEDILCTMIAEEYNTHQHVRGDLLKNFK